MEPLAAPTLNPATPRAHPPAGHDGNGNGAPRPRTDRNGTGRGGGGTRWLAWAAAAAGVLIVAAVVLGPLWMNAGAAEVPGKFYTVVPTDLEVKVKKDGELEAVENVDLQSHVEGRTTIVFIAKEGTWAKKGDLLVELDSALIRQQLLEAKLANRQAEADLQSAQELLAIQEAQNAADLQAAQVSLELANIALEQFEDGSYPQQLATAQTAVDMARITVQNKQEELDRTKSLYAKGFTTATDVQNAELSLTTVKNQLREAETSLKVLTDYTHRMEMATRENAVSQAQQALARVRTTNASLLSTAKATVETKTLALATKSAALEKLEEQLANCKIYAPSEGMVVYVYDDDDYRIAEGAEVRERQRIIRLPDTSRMKAIVKMNESQVTKLETGQRARVYLTGREPVAATLTRVNPVADSGSRWWNPDMREYPVEVELDNTPPGLQPGMRAEVEVFTAQLSDVLAVPVAAVYSDRAGSYVFVREGEGVVPKPVALAQSSDTHVRVTQGLSAGQQVLLLEPGRGRELLERAGMGSEQEAPPEEEAAEKPPAERKQEPDGEQRKPDEGERRDRDSAGEARRENDG